MKINSLQDLLVDLVKDLYSAENQLVKALPRMAKAASSAALRSGFQLHLEETKQQVERLTRVCEHLGATPKGKKCKAMEGLVEEGKELMEEKPEAALLDAGLIAAAQKVEHYEIAGYGSACTWAEQLGLSAVAKLLGETLAEEKATDEKLTELAKQSVNVKAESANEQSANEQAGAGSKAGKGKKPGSKK